MLMVKDLLDSTWQNFSARQKAHQATLAPPVFGKGVGEDFTLSYRARTVEIKAAGPKAAIFATSVAKVAIGSGYLREFLGPSAPKFSIRPLWLQGDVELLIDPHTAIVVPQFAIDANGGWDRDRLRLMSQKILELGYNSVLFRSMMKKSERKSAAPANILELKKLLKDFGLEFILSATPVAFESPFSLSYQAQMKASFSELGIDAFFWESRWLEAEYTQHPEAQEVTRYDTLLKELRLIEEVVSSEIIFYVPIKTMKDALIVRRLLDDAGSKTILAFSAVMGKPWEEGGGLNPLWQLLRESQEPIQTGLLPVINGGLVNCGQGLWPVIPFDHFERVYPKFVDHRFIGAIVTTVHLPKGHGFLDCNLWLSSQCLWGKPDPVAMLEAWGKAFRPDWGFEKELRELSLMRKIILDVESIKGCASNDEASLLAEALFGEMDALSAHFRGKALSLYVHFFVQDAKRILIHSLQQSQISSLKGHLGSCQQDSFWSKASVPKGTFATEGVKIHIHESPFINPQNKEMDAIYSENDLFVHP